MSRGENKQIAVNMIAQMAVFAIQFCISFFLTPFIVRTLGVEAYGFVGLSSNIIGYMQVVTVALNSMAARFISIEYHTGNFSKANQYFSSVFYANCIINIFISVFCLCIAFFLEYIINIPEKLVLDVKSLFLFLTVNTILNLLFNVYTVSPFVKNRLEVTSIRNLISTILRTLILLFLFGVFTPHVYYIGIASVVASIYLVIANVLINRKLTPEFNLSIKNYNWESIREILSSGVWNLLISISAILEKGFDLLLANWFISNSIMGMLSVSSTITVLIPRVLKMANSSFAPKITEYGARDDIEGIKRNVIKSVKIMSVMVILPLSVLYVYGDIFFSLWLPKQDYTMLYIITILTTLDMIFGMPLEVCWNIFGATNKVKMPALVMFFTGGMTFISLLILLSIFNDVTSQMLCLASARTFWNIIKNLTFLPVYGAKCLNLKWSYFYNIIRKPILGIILTLLICQIYRYIIVPETWNILILSSVLVSFSALLISSVFILQKEDIKYVTKRFFKIK